MKESRELEIVKSTKFSNTWSCLKSTIEWYAFQYRTFNKRLSLKTKLESYQIHGINKIRSHGYEPMTFFPKESLANLWITQIIKEADLRKQKTNLNIEVKGLIIDIKIDASKIEENTIFAAFFKKTSSWFMLYIQPP